MWRRLVGTAAVVAGFVGCSGEGSGPEPSRPPHPPTTASEREAVREYERFVQQLSRGELASACTRLEPDAQRTFGCARRSLRVPKRFRRLGVRTSRIAVYPTSLNEVLLAAPVSRGHPSDQLFVSFDSDDPSRIRWAVVGPAGD
jgi:hypothetical protein